MTRNGLAGKMFILLFLLGLSTQLPGRQFEMQFYPKKAYGIGEGNTTCHPGKRMTYFILKNL